MPHFQVYKYIHEISRALPIVLSTDIHDIDETFTKL